MLGGLRINKEAGNEPKQSDHVGGKNIFNKLLKIVYLYRFSTDKEQNTNILRSFIFGKNIFD